MMFSVIFEVHPRPEQWDAYLANAKMLRPELVEVQGFVDNIRYKSLTRDGWILSLSGWRDEKSVVRWRTRMRHHEVQERGRSEILFDYHLRVGQITFDTHVPEGCEILEQRLDETEVGEGTAITLIDAKQSPEWVTSHNAEEVALYLGFDFNSYGECISWDVFDAVLSPGEIILMVSWKNADAAKAFAQSAMTPDEARVRAVRVVRDYAMFDRREAPQYYPDAAGRETIRA
jgi:heme-degrading monooxygenase HmoA